MTTTDAKQLIAGAITTQDSSEWVDLGCGAGTFAYALADLLAVESKIHAVDKLQQYLNSRKAGVTLEFIKADFEKQEMHFKNIAGVIMANSLHYVEDQLDVILRIKPWLKADGKIILIEYDTVDSNAWVPYPITYERATEMFESAGFTSVTKIGEMNSRLRQETIFCCMAML
ncbi:MAG TPA: methyltransferase domain-containing protein [Cyclobacteriaceae bacterium]